MKLIEKMEAEVARKIEAILAEAKQKAAAIEGSAEEAIADLKKDARLATEKRLVLEKARKTAKVTQVFKRQEAELKRDLVDAVFEAARKELDEFADSGDYDEAFERLAEEAFEDLEGKALVSVREGDGERARGALSAANVEGEVSEDLRGHGAGLLIRSPNGLALVDNTLYTRLERARIEGVLASGQILFGDGEAEGAAEPEEKKAPAKKKANAKKRSTKSPKKKS